MARRRRPARPGALADLAPLRILTQIVVLQFIYYAVALVLVIFTTFVAGGRPNLKQLLDWRELRGDVTTGWTLALCWMLDSLVTVIPILLLIARSKLVPDFALTIHFVHLLVTSFYSRSVPTAIYWWLVNAASAFLMTSLGMWACQWRELKPITFGGRAKQRVEPDKAAAALEDGEGFAMGSGRGRGRDGAGTYEMVNVNASEPT